VTDSRTVALRGIEAGEYLAKVAREQLGREHPLGDETLETCAKCGDDLAAHSRELLRRVEAGE
jgi:hypothetical protein